MGTVRKAWQANWHVQYVVRDCLHGFLSEVVFDYVSFGARTTAEQLCVCRLYLWGHAYFNGMARRRRYPRWKMVELSSTSIYSWRRTTRCRNRSTQ